jgi:integrase
MPRQKARSRGQIVPKGLNKWLVRISLPVGPDGKRRSPSKLVEGTYNQAQRELTAWLRELDTSSFVEPSKQTVAEYLEQWIASKVDVTERTRRDYDKRLKADILPELGHLKLHEVTPQLMQRHYQSLTAKGYSPRTIEYTHAVFHHALEQAVEWHMIVRNPTDAVRLPKKTKRAPSVLSMKQVSLLLEKTIDDAMSCLWRLLLTSGMRPQEALGLKWSDLQGSWLSIARVAEDNGLGAWAIKDVPKTDSANRTIGLPESTVAALRVHKARQAAEILVAGSKYERNDLIFPNSLGRILDMNLVRRRWKAVLKECQLPTTVRLYDTRHTHLTALLQNGADLAWVASRAGHSDIKMTRDHYAHVLPETHRQMGEMTETMLRKAAAES